MATPTCVPCLLAWSRTLQIGLLASLAVAAVAISRSSGSGQEPL